MNQIKRIILVTGMLVAGISLVAISQQIVPNSTKVKDENKNNERSAQDKSDPHDDKNIRSDGLVKIYGAQRDAEEEDSDIENDLDLDLNIDLNLDLDEDIEVDMDGNFDVDAEAMDAETDEHIDADIIQDIDEEDDAQINTEDNDWNKTKDKAGKLINKNKNKNKDKDKFGKQNKSKGLIKIKP